MCDTCICVNYIVPGNMNSHFQTKRGSFSVIGNINFNVNGQIEVRLQASQTSANCIIFASKISPITKMCIVHNLNHSVIDLRVSSPYSVQKAIGSRGVHYRVSKYWVNRTWLINYTGVCETRPARMLCDVESISCPEHKPKDLDN